MSTDALRRASEAIAAAANPDEGVEVLVESLLTGLDGSERTARFSAAWAACIVASAAPDTVAPLAHELGDRLADATDDRLLARTLATLGQEAPEVVDEALAATADGNADVLRARVSEADPWDLDDVVAEDGAADEPGRRIVRIDRTAEDPDATGVGHVDRSESDRTAADAPSVLPPEEEGGAGDATPTPGPEAKRRRRIEAVAESETFTTVEYHSEFEDLSVLAPPEERRFGQVVRTRATRHGEDAGVAIRLFDRPDDDRPAFESHLTDRLETWAEVDDVPGVLTIHDCGDSPRPWAGSAYADYTLSTLGRRSPEDALWDARVLTGAVADLHQRGVVHAGIGPRSVVYDDDSIGGSTRPLLDAVGLMFAYREHFDPADFLDPRFAAPEYFSRTYGRIDQSTDVYQLGAVCYRLFTGRPPYDGDFETVREQVLSDQPPRPTAVDPSLPDAVDDVVAKAMGTGKLSRYDTAVRFHREVATLCDELLSTGSDD